MPPLGQGALPMPLPVLIPFALPSPTSCISKDPASQQFGEGALAHQEEGEEGKAGHGLLTH